MKRDHILALLMLVVAIFIFVNASNDIATYYNFTTATTASGEVKVNGTLDPNHEIIYDPVENANMFSFFMLDTEGKSVEVKMASAMPQDFERSEQVVVKGSLKGDSFVATEILTKCPSKYKDEEIYIRADS